MDNERHAIEYDYVNRVRKIAIAIGGKYVPLYAYQINFLRALSRINSDAVLRIEKSRVSVQGALQNCTINAEELRKAFREMGLIDRPATLDTRKSRRKGQRRHQRKIMGDGF